MGRFLLGFILGFVFCSTTVLEENIVLSKETLKTKVFEHKGIVYKIQSLQE